MCMCVCVWGGEKAWSERFEVCKRPGGEMNVACIVMNASDASGMWGEVGTCDRHE